MVDFHRTNNEVRAKIVNSGISQSTEEDDFLLGISHTNSNISKNTYDNNQQLRPNNVLQLQRKLGNQATMKIVARQKQLEKNNQDSPLPFTGLKMVTPDLIQREDDDDENAGPITRQDALDEKEVNPNEAVELDGSDQENQEESNEIDQVIQEAQGLQIPQPNDDLIGQDQGNTPSTQNQAVDIANGDDEDSNGVFTQVVSQQTTDYGDDEDSNGSFAQVASHQSIDYGDDDDLTSSSVGNIGTNTVIKKRRRHKQKQGTHINGHYLAAQAPNPALGQAVTDTGRHVSTGIQMAQAVDAVKSANSFKGALENVSDTGRDTGSEGLVGMMKQVMQLFNTPPLSVILPIVPMIYRINAARIKYKHMKAYKNLMGANNGDKSLAKKRSTTLADKGTIGAYGFAKTKRGFWLRVVKAAISLGQVISRLITVLSGGTTAFVTETIALAGSLSSGVIKLGQSLKGIYKMIIGKRGKRRIESANWIVDAALDGDEEMLQFMIDSNALSNKFILKRKQEYLTYKLAPELQTRLDSLELLAKQPQTTDEMQIYLQEARDANMLLVIKTQVAIMTKST